MAWHKCTKHKEEFFNIILNNKQLTKSKVQDVVFSICFFSRISESDSWKASTEEAVLYRVAFPETEGKIKNTKSPSL